MRLLLFNPETEYALASGASFYTPPARVEKLRMSNQLLPEAWAEKGDVILVDDAVDHKSEFLLVDWTGLQSLFELNPDIKIDPWGWNHALWRKLRDYGVPESSLPPLHYIDAIREMAHRRNTIRLNMLWNEKLSEISCSPKVDIPREFFTEKECIDFWHENMGCWLKAPWSSSGRGVINTAADMTEEQIKQWCRGIIRRQGSVMGETGADRVGDYATEWRLTDGVACYLGLSSFSTSNRGKYLSNNELIQSIMSKEFNNSSKIEIEQVIAFQKMILEDVYSGYEGLLGVDMIVERDGMLRPFVEVNLRRTMGMGYIKY